MTLNVALGLIPANADSRSGERGKNMPADGQRFEEALAGGAGKRKTAEPRLGDHTGETRPSWKMETYGTRLGIGTVAGENRESGDGDAFRLLLGITAPAGDEETLESAPAVPEDAQAALPGEDGEADTGDEAAQALAVAANAAQAPTGDDRKARMDAALRETDDAGAGRRKAGADDAPHRDRPNARAMTANTSPGDDSSVRQDTRPQQAQSPAGRAAPEPLQRQEGYSSRGEAVRQTGPAGDFQLQGKVTGMPAAPATDALAGRVNVLGFSTALAPAPAMTPLLGATAAGLVSAIEGEPSWRSAAAEAALAGTQRSPTSFAGVNSLRIQLHPAELGMVTARLTASGSQLSIEIRVESNDARQRLANDSDAILKALRAVGYDVEKVTIQQSSQTASGNGQQNATGGREQFLADQQARDEAGARGQGGQNAAGRESKENGHGQGDAAADRPRGGVYI